MPYMLSCDSTTDLTLAQYAALNLHYVSLHFLLDGKEYPDDYGQSLPMKTFFDAMAAGATTGTSQVTTGEFELYFRQFLEQGSDILHVSLSSGLSGCYHSACAARDMLLEEFPERKIIVVDSLCGSGGAAILMLEAARQRDAGRTMEETAAWIEARRLHVHHWLFTPDRHAPASVPCDRGKLRGQADPAGENSRQAARLARSCGENGQLCRGRHGL